MDKIGVASRLLVPTDVLDEGVVNAQVHCGGAAVGHGGNHLRGNTAILDERQHLHHPVTVINQRLRCTRRWLEPSVIALRGEDALHGEPRQLELTVDVGRHHKRLGEKP